MSHNTDYEDLMFECVRALTKRRRAWKAEREMAEHCEKDVEP